MGDIIPKKWRWA